MRTSNNMDHHFTARDFLPMQNKTMVKKGVGLALSYAMISGGA
jgi:hypothetical protein